MDNRTSISFYPKGIGIMKTITKSPEMFRVIIKYMNLYTPKHKWDIKRVSNHIDCQVCEVAQWISGQALLRVDLFDRIIYLVDENIHFNDCQLIDRLIRSYYADANSCGLNPPSALVTQHIVTLISTKVKQSIHENAIDLESYQRLCILYGSHNVFCALGKLGSTVALNPLKKLTPLLMNKNSIKDMRSTISNKSNTSSVRVIGTYFVS